MNHKCEGVRLQRILKIKKLNGNDTPKYAHSGDAGMDLRSAVDVINPPHTITAVPTGICAEIPEGCVGLQFSRSGHGLKGISLANSVGVIDSGFRGEIMAEMFNGSDEPLDIHKGDRICQMVVMPYVQCLIREFDDLDDSDRDTNGFGSTGVK